MPVGRVLQGVLFDGAGDPTHFAQADSASHAYDAGEQYRALNRSAVLPAQMGQALGESRRAVDRRQDFGEGHEVALGEIARQGPGLDRSEEQTSELQSLMRRSYACFCLKK